jgi:hypothetical protein
MKYLISDREEELRVLEVEKSNEMSGIYFTENAALVVFVVTIIGLVGKLNLFLVLLGAIVWYIISHSGKKVRLKMASLIDI